MSKAGQTDMSEKKELPVAAIEFMESCRESMDRRTELFVEAIKSVQESNKVPNGNGKMSTKYNTWFEVLKIVLIPALGTLFIYITAIAKLEVKFEALSDRLNGFMSESKQDRQNLHQMFLDHVINRDWEKKK